VSHCVWKHAVEPVAERGIRYVEFARCLTYSANLFYLGASRAHVEFGIYHLEDIEKTLVKL